MKFRYRKTIWVAVVLMVALLLTVSASNAAPPEATYEITITNMTSGQPLTPPLIATHRKAVRFFQVGKAASFELKEIAENGNLDPMLAKLNESKHVLDVVVATAGSPPPLLPGQYVTVDITAAKNAKFLSFASMLICTNDGFTGIDSLKLPKQVGESVTVSTDGYDAGTEMNTEDFADLVPPCPLLTGVESDDAGTGMSNPALAEDENIRHHPGIEGIADLDPDLHGWDDPVAEVTIERVE